MNVLKRTVSPQPIKLKLDIKTLNDVQKLAGMLNWLRPYLGLTNEQMQPLLQLLKGDTDLLAPRYLTLAALALLKEVEELISSRHVWCVDITLPLSGFILMDQSSPYAMLAQWNQAWEDPLHVLEWFLPLQPKKTAVEWYELVADLIIKVRKRCLELTGADPATVIIPVQQFYVEWALLNSTALQVALANFQGQVQYQHPPHPLLKMTVNLTLRPRQ